MNASSKVSLYDMFAMVIPGFLLLMLPVIYCDCFHWHSDTDILCCRICTECYIIKNDSIFIFIMFIASYIVGLMYHQLISVFCGSNKHKTKRKRSVIEYITLIRCFRNNPSRIKKAGRKIAEEYDENYNEHLKDDEKYTVHNYYKAYYRLMDKNCLNSIPVLEAQVVLLRNMIVTTLIYIIPLFFTLKKMCYLSLNPLSIATVLVVITIIMFLLKVKIQDKIYELVWEGEKYLSDD